MTYALTLTATLATSIALAGTWFVRSLDAMGGTTDEDAAIPA